MKYPKTKLLRSLYCMLIASVLYGCGSDDSSPGPNSNYLTGAWGQECMDNGGNTFITRVIEFENTNIIRMIDNIYGDGTCFSDLLDSYELVGNYTLGADVITTTGETATEINVTMVEEDGVPIPVNEQRTGYRIVYVEGDYLYGGDEEADPDLDGTTPARRSNILETVPYVYRDEGFNTNPMVGTWIDSCLDNPNGTYVKETVVIGTNTMDFTIRYYNDSACSDLNSTVTENVDYSLGNTVLTGSGVTAYEMDLMVGTTVFFYSLIYFDGVDLYFGEHSATYDGTTSATRAVDVDFTDPYIRQ